MFYQIGDLKLELVRWNSRTDRRVCLPTLWAGERSQHLSAQLHLLSKSDYVKIGEFPTRPFQLIATSIDSFESKLYRYLIRNLKQWTMLHCGAVKIGTNVLLFPGLSGAGKSTLVQALCNRGAGYLSDEWIFVDDEGTLYPYPRALKLKRPERRELREPVGLGNLTAVHIVFTTYQPRSKLAPKPVSLSAGCLELLQNCPQIHNRSLQALSRLSRLARQSRLWRTPRPEAEQAAEEFMRLYSKGGDDDSPACLSKHLNSQA